MPRKKTVNKRVGIKSIENSFTPERKELHLKLKNKRWFKNTSSVLKRKLLSLTDEFNGFLSDLSERPEIIGNVEVLRLNRLEVGNYIAVPVFKVRSLQTNEEYTYEYASWKYGKRTGYKGIILLEVDGKISYFITRKSIKFPTTESNYEAIGTFEPALSTSRIINFPKSIDKQLKKALGISDVKFTKYVDLGDFSPDAGMSNQKITLFTCIINLNNTDSINKFFNNQKYDKNPGYEIEIHPIERISDMISKSEDGFLLAIISKLLAINILSL